MKAFISLQLESFNCSINIQISVIEITLDIYVRTRAGVVPPLATRATSAAWPPPSVNVLGPIDGPAMESTTPLQANRQGMSFKIDLYV